MGSLLKRSCALYIFRLGSAFLLLQYSGVYGGSVRDILVKNVWDNCLWNNQGFIAQRTEVEVWFSGGAASFLGNHPKSLGAFSHPHLSPKILICLFWGRVRISAMKCEPLLMHV